MWKMRYKIVTNTKTYHIIESINTIVIEGVSDLKDFLLDLDNTENQYIIQEQEGEEL